MNLTAQTFTGLKWSYLSTGINTALQVGVSAVMARLLTPADFGLVAMAGVVLGLANFISRLGIGSAVVQKDELNDEDVRAAGCLAIGLGTVVFTGVVVGAPLALLLFDQPLVVPVLRVMAVSFLISGMTVTASALLRREMAFDTIAMIEVASYVVGFGIVGLSLAALGFGVWSLVIAGLSQQGVACVLAYLVARPGLRPVTSWVTYRFFVSFGGRLSVVSFLEYIGNTLDTLLIGRFFGASPLGLYNRAHMLSALPMYRFMDGLSRVLFPSFSRAQSDGPKLRRAYLSALMLSAAIMIPVCAGLAVCAREAVLLLLGNQWLGAIPVLQVLALAMPLQLLTTLSGITCEATATLNIKIVVQTAFVLVLTAAFFTLRRYELVGFALAILVAQSIRHALYASVMARLLHVAPHTLLRAYAPGLLFGSTVAAALFTLTFLMQHLDTPVAVAFPVQVATGAIVLTLLTLMGPSSAVRDEMSRVLVHSSSPTSRRAVQLLHRFAPDRSRLAENG